MKQGAAEQGLDLVIQQVILPFAGRDFERMIGKLVMQHGRTHAGAVNQRLCDQFALACLHMQIEEEERVLMSKDDALNQLVTLTGGRAAEEVVFHSITSGASNDIEKATAIARAMVTRFGM